jgi:hypothetical protein
MLQIGRTFRPQVDDDVVDCAARAANHLAFGGRRVLEMHPAHRSAPEVRRDVCLSYKRLQAMRREFSLTEGAREKSARVLAAIEIENERAFQMGFLEQHEHLLTEL